MWIILKAIGDKSTLVQVMTWCHERTWASVDVDPYRHMASIGYNEPYGHQGYTRIDFETYPVKYYHCCLLQPISVLNVLIFSALNVSNNKCMCWLRLQVPDGMGRASRLLLWNHPGNDVTGMVGRCEKMVNTCEEVKSWMANLLNTPMPSDAYLRQYAKPSLVQIMACRL